MDEVGLFSWILRGKQRRVIFQVIEGKMIPAQIYEKAKVINPKITRNSVSDILKTFRENGLVECLNPEEKMGRIYSLTVKGENLKKKF